MHSTLSVPSRRLHPSLELADHPAPRRHHHRPRPRRTDSAQPFTTHRTSRIANLPDFGVKPVTVTADPLPGVADFGDHSCTLITARSGPEGRLQPASSVIRPTIRAGTRRGSRW